MLLKRLRERVVRLLDHEAIKTQLSAEEIAEVRRGLDGFDLIEILVLIAELLAMVIDWLRNR